MAVYRQIQITYWQDSFVLKLTPEEKFFYLYLLTNSKTKQCGIYELPLAVIQIETGYNRGTVIKLIQRFIEHKKIAYDWENEEVFIHNWVKHNPFDNNPKILKCIEKELISVHNPDLIPLTSPLQGVYKGLHNKNKKKNNNKNNNKEEILGLFDNYFTNNEPLKKVWFEWVDFRSATRKSLTELSAKKQLEFLTKQPDPIKCINNSIQNQWQGLFEVKNGKTINNTRKGEYDPEQHKRLLNSPPI